MGNEKQLPTRPLLTTPVSQGCTSPQSGRTLLPNPVVRPIPKESPIPPDDPSSLNRRYAKSFNCNQCKKPFPSLSLLCEHTFAVHRAFRCTICGAQFTQRSNLQRHSLRHVGFKPFVCKVCDKAYYRKDHLVRHIELTHPGCDPRNNLTVKLSSAECLDYLEQKLQNKDEPCNEQAETLSDSACDSKDSIKMEIVTNGESIPEHSELVCSSAPKLCYLGLLIIVLTFRIIQLSHDNGSLCTLWFFWFLI